MPKRNQNHWRSTLLPTTEGVPLSITDISVIGKDDEDLVSSDIENKENICSGTENVEERKQVEKDVERKETIIVDETDTLEESEEEEGESIYLLDKDNVVTQTNCK
ncbi:hypothetical protein SNEBB_002444 [Seison nebaliae]|nr:hypothetical protein SNEBB_002444 [Seison nebaliae]